MAEQPYAIAFPAYAGMNRIFPLPCGVSGGVPRLRGDEPSLERVETVMGTRSPPTRG